VERSAAFRVVAQFEEALCEFTGAPYAVRWTVARTRFLAFQRSTAKALCEFTGAPCAVLAHTYVGVAHAASPARVEMVYVGSRRWTRVRMVWQKWDYQLKPRTLLTRRSGSSATCTSRGRLTASRSRREAAADRARRRDPPRQPRGERLARKARLDGGRRAPTTRTTRSSAEGTLLHDPSRRRPRLVAADLHRRRRQGDWTEYPI
jgi:hypothetical protein